MKVRAASLQHFLLLLAGLLVFDGAAALAQAPRTWTATGSMSTSRRFAAIERLPDGRFLVAGGTHTTGVDFSATQFFASAEIFDPATGNWTATGSMATARSSASSAVLPDGKILIAGGRNLGSAALNSAEIFNPATGTFSATGSMATARAGAVDTVLPDGRVLITGGRDASGTPLTSAEVFNPGTGTFSATGSMSTARRGHRADLVGDGKVLVSGGFTAGNAPLATTELFNPATGTFGPGGSMSQARGQHRSELLPTGEVLVAGGSNGAAVLASAELYDPDTNFGGGTDVPVPADYDGDGRTDIAVYRNGLWIYQSSSTGTHFATQFGGRTDVPLN